MWELMWVCSRHQTCFLRIRQGLARNNLEVLLHELLDAMTQAWDVNPVRAELCVQTTSPNLFRENVRGSPWPQWCIISFCRMKTLGVCCSLHLILLEIIYCWKYPCVVQTRLHCSSFCQFIRFSRCSMCSPNNIALFFVFDSLSILFSFAIAMTMCLGPLMW